MQFKGRSSSRRHTKFVGNIMVETYILSIRQGLNPYRLVTVGL